MRVHAFTNCGNSFLDCVFAHRTASTSDGLSACATPTNGVTTRAPINLSPRIRARTSVAPQEDNSARALASPAQPASIFRPGERVTIPPVAAAEAWTGRDTEGEVAARAAAVAAAAVSVSVSVSVPSLA